MYPRRLKAEAFSNAVDVVKRLRVPTDPSTERTTPPRSAHVQHSDVPRTLDPAKAEGEFRQHDGVLMVMMKLLICLQRIYNFLLLHAILSTILGIIGLYYPLLYYFWD